MDTLVKENIVEIIHQEFDSAHIVLKSILDANIDGIRKSIETEEENIDTIYKEISQFAFKNIGSSKNEQEKLKSIGALKEKLNHNMAYNSAIKEYNKNFLFYKYIDIPSLYRILDKI